MCGVDQEYRRKGLIKLLMNESFQQAGKEGYLYVTINTYKDKFPAIYSYLTNYGFKEYKKEKTRSVTAIKRRASIPKGIKDKAPVIPRSDKTENPHEEHPATTMPKTVLPPTVKFSFT